MVCVVCVVRAALAAGMGMGLLEQRQHPWLLATKEGTKGGSGAVGAVGGCAGHGCEAGEGAQQRQACKGSCPSVHGRQGL